jgi:hypothetical protein
MIGFGRKRAALEGDSSEAPLGEWMESSDNSEEENIVKSEVGVPKTFGATLLRHRSS